MNDLNWNKEKAIYKYELNTGNYSFIIKSSNKISLKYYNKLKPNCNLPKTKIIIWMEKDEELKKEFLHICDKKCKKYIPKWLKMFYNSCNRNLSIKYDIEKHVNEYYRNNDNIYLCFNYKTDKFYVCYKENTNEMFLIGNEENLERVIVDFLTVTSEVLPLHALAVGKNGEGIGIIGESNSGKTSFMIKLLERGMNFLTDDALFIDDKKDIVRVNTSFSIRKNYPNNFKLKEYCKDISQDKVVISLEKAKNIMKMNYENKVSSYKFFKLNDIKKVEELKEPFPCISKHSFWCLPFLIKENNNQEEYIEQTMHKSILEWNKILVNSQTIKLDFNNFDKFTDKFIKTIR